MSRPSLVKLKFLSEDPADAWQKCVEAQENWERHLSSQEKYAKEMDEFKVKMAAKTIWMTNVLEDTLPNGINEKDANNSLIKAYKGIKMEALLGDANFSQLAQHLRAFELLCSPPALASLPILTEDLIERAHGIMMKGLRNEQGLSINAGSYRSIPVFAGCHVFPSHKCIPNRMSDIVRSYNEKAATVHDTYELASWLHFNVVSLHPFEDGNGRISRLLWCYSLMRDGLPFPAVLSSGHKKSQKHLVMCLKRDRDRFNVTDNPHMTTLTVVSVDRTWQEYFSTIHG